MGDEDLEPEDEDDEEAEGPELSEEIEIYTSLLNYCSFLFIQVFSSF